MSGNITIRIPTVSREGMLAALNAQSAPKHKRKRPSHPEDDFQKCLVAALHRILDPRVIMAAVPNGGYRTRAEAGILKAMGVLAGFPDLLFLWDAHAYCLELKAPNGRVSTAQRECHQKLNRNAIGIDVVRTIDEALFCLKAAGVPLRIKD